MALFKLTIQEVALSTLYVEANTLEEAENAEVVSDRMTLDAVTEREVTETEPVDARAELFAKGYIEAMYFTETGDAGEPASDAPLSDGAWRHAHYDADLYWAAIREHVPEGRETEAGHDFWLTRNGHGAGFWDGDWPEPQATALTKVAEAAGGVDTCEGYGGTLDLM